MKFPEVIFGTLSSLSQLLSYQFKDEQMKYLLFCQPLRSKLLLLLFAIQEVFHGLKLMSIKLMRTSWIGCKLCLAFRKGNLRFCWLLYDLYCLCQLQPIYFLFFNILSTSDMQTDSVSNQREHLILLLANIHIRRNPKTDQQSKVFFCKYSTTRLIWFKNSYFSSCFTTFMFFLFLLMFFLFSLKLTTSFYMILVAVG